MHPAHHVLVFDSGVGGLSIVREIRSQLPNACLTYVADSLYFPYGTKSEAFLVQRIVDLITAVASHTHPDLIVLACNSASTVVLPELRTRLAIPVVGVVPAIKPAAEASSSGMIALIATPGTVARPYTRELQDRFAAHCEVIMVGSSELVEIAEAKLQGIPPDLTALRRILLPALGTLEKATDVIVLGCTHFPLLQPELQWAVPEYKGLWLDSGRAIARRVEQVLGSEPSPSRYDSQQTAYLTKGLGDKLMMENMFMPFGFTEIRLWP